MKNPFDATGTIGSLACEKSLNLILAEKNDPKLIKKITKLVHFVKFQLKQLNQITEESSRNYFRTLLRKEAEQSISRITGVAVRGVPITDYVASHTMCCVNAYFSISNEEYVQ